MNKTRTAAKWFAGLAVVSTLFLAMAAPAQARDTGWDPTHAHRAAPTDTGWDPTLVTKSATPTDTGWDPTR